MQEHIRAIITALGEDPEREGLKKTPLRVEKALRVLTSGYDTKLEDILNGATFEERTDGMIIIQDIEFYSLCEHHMLPFFGKCHIGYFPKKKIIGLSKIPRIVNMFSNRLQVQERMTREIAETIQEAIDPHGVAVVTQADHMCIMMRGVEKQHSKTTSSCMLGAFREDPKSRSEFLSLIGKN